MRLFAATLGFGSFAWDAAQMPTRPADSGAVGQSYKRPRIVTRLVPLALMAAAAAVVVSATGQGHGSPRARVAADTTPSVVVPDGQPTLAAILNAQFTGDAILLRVDPVGSATPLTMVVSPGARVVGQPLEVLLGAAADQKSAMHGLRYRLSYDPSGAIIAIAPA